MIWQIGFSSDALKSLKRNNIQEEFIIDRVNLTIRKLRGEEINIDIKKLRGEWEGFHRIRVGKLRIILSFNFEKNRVYIDKIDWRGSAYK